MELITTIALLSLFSFFYFLGRKDEDYPLELLGAFGIMFTGIMLVALKVSMAHITEAGDLIFLQLPTTEAFSWIVFFLGFFLMFMTIRTLMKMSKIKEPRF